VSISWHDYCRRLQESGGCGLSCRRSVQPTDTGLRSTHERTNTWTPVDRAARRRQVLVWTLPGRGTSDTLVVELATVSPVCCNSERTNDDRWHRRQSCVAPASWNIPNIVVYYSNSDKTRCHMPNTHRRRRQDETVESRRFGGVYWAISFFFQWLNFGSICRVRPSSKIVQNLSSTRYSQKNCYENRIVLRIVQQFSAKNFHGLFVRQFTMSDAKCCRLYFSDKTRS